jgi:predicted DNA-binding protein YlxM (UPF0122 family)
MKRQLKPWTDQRGLPLHTEELKRVSRVWDEQTWEAYLKTIESKSSGQLFGPGVYQDLCEENIRSIFADTANENNDEVKIRVEKALEALSKHSEKQTFVIKEIFWNGKSQHDVAGLLRIQQNAVFDLKQRAIKNLKKIMKELQVLVNPPLMKGEKKSFLEESQNRTDQIAEVMQSEINRTEAHESFWRKK